MKKIITIIILIFSIIGMLSFTANIGTKIKSNSDNDDETIIDSKYSELYYSALGDSITEGSLSEDGTMTLGYSYPEVVHKLMGFKKTYNLGLCGSTMGVGSRPMYERYKNIPLNSNIISIAGGNNDSNTYLKEIGTIDDNTAETFYGALNIIVKGVLNRYPKAFVFLITRGPWDDITTDIGTKYSDYVNATKNIGEKYNLPVLDIFNNEELYADVKSNNNSHPSTKAMEEIFGPLVAQFIKDNYK